MACQRNIAILTVFLIFSSVAASLLLGLIIGLEGSHLTMCTKTAVHGCTLLGGAGGYAKSYNISFRSSICSGTMDYLVRKSITTDCNASYDLATANTFVCYLYDTQYQSCLYDPVKSSWYLVALILGAAFAVLAVGLLIYVITLVKKSRW